jgi:hypothetical protein
LGAPPNPIVLLKTIGIAGSTPRKDFSAVVQIHPHAEAELLEIVDATGLTGLGFGLGKGGQKHRRENCDNGDNHEQFD